MWLSPFSRASQHLTSSPPLSSVPFDLLFLHAVVPPSLESLRAKQRGKKFLNSWWKAVSRSFKLTDLLNGKRPSSTLRPESKLVLTLWAILDIPFQFVFGKYNTESTLARVPAHDRTALLSPAERKGSGNGVFIPLDDKGRPKTLEGKIKWLKQDRAAREAKRDPWKDYRVVWLPVYWRTRVHSLIFGAVGSCAAALAVVALVPLLVGRLFTAWLMGLWGGEVGAEMHDGYSLVSPALVAILLDQSVLQSPFA
jgi:E3 ubiquitin-protein ligase MARCH6